VSSYRGDLSPSDRQDIEELRQAREWWKRPDPFDPRNAPDEPETVDHTTELLEALRKCQAALAMLTAPDAIKSSSVLHAWAHCVEAEAAARAAISKATGGDQ